MDFQSAAAVCAIVFFVYSSSNSEYVHEAKYNHSVYDKPVTSKQATRSISAGTGKFGYKGKTNNYNLDRQPGLFSAITALIGGSAIDTFTAYRNISRLIQNAFPSTRPGAPNNGTTTFTINQALQLFGRNYRGLRRLFDREFVRALNDSDQNVLAFSKELKNSMKPFFQPNRNLTLVN